MGRMARIETSAERRNVSGTLLVSGAPRRTAQACRTNAPASVVRPAALRYCEGVSASCLNQ